MLSDFAMQANSFCLNFIVIFVSIIAPVGLIGILGCFIWWMIESIRK